MIRDIFKLCVDILNYLAALLGTDYYTINIVIFCVVWPLVFIYMGFIIYKQQKILRARKLTYKSYFLVFTILIIIFSALIIFFSKTKTQDFTFDRYIYQYSDSKDFNNYISSDTLFVDSYIDLDKLIKNSRMYAPLDKPISFSRIVCFWKNEQTYISYIEKIY